MNVQSWCLGVPLTARDVPAEMSTAGGVFAGWDGVDEFGRQWRRGSYVGGAFSGWDDLHRCLRDAMAGDGFMLATSNSLHHACTVEAVTEMYRYGREAGRY